MSLGVIAGLALGGIAPKNDWHFFWLYDCIMVSSQSIPFFVAAALMVAALMAAIRWLPESLSVRTTANPPERRSAVGRRLWSLLCLATAGQFGLTIFEGTFAVYAQQKMGYGPSGLAIIFMVCGSVMAVFQVLLAWWLAGRLSELRQLAAGFALMGVGITLLLFARSLPAVLGSVATLAMGMAFISPNLSALISRAADKRAGASLGLQGAANSLGQAGGPIVGSLLFVWHSSAPYALAGALMFADANADTFAGFDDQRLGAGKGLGVHGENVEFGHLVGIRSIGAWVNAPLMKEQYKVAIHLWAVLLPIAFLSRPRMNHE